MYTRGQFAIIGNVGRKALRLYEEKGILIPQEVNEENGYHYYSEQQIGELARIKRLRKYGISLSQIKSIVEGIVSEQEIVALRKEDMCEEIARKQKLLLEIDGHLEKTEPQNTKDLSADKIDYAVFPACNCLWIKENVELEQLGKSVGKLYERASRLGLLPKGDHFVVYDGLLREDGAFTMTTHLPVDCEKEETIKQADLFGVHMRFTGGFSKTGEAHRRLKAYVDANKLKISGKALEVYRPDWSVDIYYEMV